MGLSELAGGGGTERYFADVFAAYDHAVAGAFDLFLIADKQSLEQLAAVGRPLSGKRVLEFNARLSSLRGIRQLCGLCDKSQIDLLHIPLASPRYLPFLWYLQSGSRCRRPRIAVTMPDCSVSHTWRRPWRCRSLGELKAWGLYRLYFHSVRLDGVLSWYQHFLEQVGAPAIRSRPTVVPASYCFVDSERFRPAADKVKHIVFAGRLTRVKRPILFLDGLELALSRAPNLFEGWKIAVYGRGPLEGKVAQRMASDPLRGRVVLSSTPDMAAIFAQSRLFVSTQDYDNFTSLSMLEAMASGNAVIARDVGQTSLFVRHNENGLLFGDDTPENLAGALIAYLSHPQRYAAMQAESRRIAVEHHNVRNALADLDRFWLQTLDRTGRGAV